MGLPSLSPSEVLSLLRTWTLEHGAALVPHGADTFGEGMRQAKEQVARILGRLAPSMDEHTRTVLTRSLRTMFDQLFQHYVTTADAAEFATQAAHLDEIARLNGLLTDEGGVVSFTLLATASIKALS